MVYKSADSRRPRKIVDDLLTILLEHWKQTDRMSDDRLWDKLLRMRGTKPINLKFV